MIIETWVFVLIFMSIVVIAAIALAGWIYEGEKLRKSEEDNKILLYQNSELAEQVARLKALENIRVANKYAKEKK